MLQEAINAMNEDVLRDMLARRGLGLADVEDLGGFESFVYRCNGRGTILRATHASHRGPDQLRAELEWIAALADDGGPVSRPLPDAHGALLTTVQDFYVCEFETAPGRMITADDWGPELFRAWGEAMGHFHAHAQRFDPVWRRIHWLDDDNFFIAGKVPADESLVHEQMAAVHTGLTALPEDDALFGLIHCDLHAGNFFVDSGRLTFFDFDDACYCWFGYDAATVLFSAIRQSWHESTRDAEQAEAVRFLPFFLDGYARNSDPAGLLPAHWPLFLKLREISLYGVIRAHFEIPERAGDYPARFMVGRRERIEAGEPYLDIDFTRFF